MMGVFVQVNEGNLNPMALAHPIGYVIQENGCWEWVGDKNVKGYGKWYSTEHATNLAHRIMYTIKRGPIPAGLHIDHLCRNPGCVNPDHMEPVTPGENVFRGTSLVAQRKRRAHCVNGHPYNSDSQYTSPKGYRQCRVCRRIRNGKAG